MATSFPTSMKKLVAELAKLPSVGERSATRLAFHLLGKDRKQAENLSKALLEASSKVILCEECGFYAENADAADKICEICSTTREKSILCVVEKPSDVVAIEKSAEFHGVYHVLHGLWSPLRGIGPEELRLPKLLARVTDNQIKEVIIATNATVEGDATATYISRMLQEVGVKSSRPAQGIPKGGELEYADEYTLARAIVGRVPAG